MQTDQTLRELLTTAHRQGATLKRKPANHGDRDYHAYEMALPGGGRLTASRHIDSVEEWWVTVSRGNVHYIEVGDPSVGQLIAAASLVGLDGGTP